MNDPYELPLNTDPSVLKIRDVELTTKMTFPAYTISAAVFFGQFLLTLFMITGLVVIPSSFITAWRDRPKPMSENQFKQEKEKLARQIDNLLQTGRKLYDSKVELDGKQESSGMFGGFKNMKQSRALNKE